MMTLLKRFLSPSPKERTEEREEFRQEIKEAYDARLRLSDALKELSEARSARRRREIDQ